MKWRKIYESRMVEARAAIKEIKDGDHVVFSDGAGIPHHVASVLAQHREEYKKVYIYHMLALGEKEYLQPECYGHFRHQYAALPVAVCEYPLSNVVTYVTTLRPPCRQAGYWTSYGQILLLLQQLSLLLHI